jgi:hypothetical protein
MKIIRSMRPSRRIEASEGERRRSKTSAQEVARSSSRRRLTSYKPIAAKGPTRANPDKSGKSNGRPPLMRHRGMASPVYRTKAASDDAKRGWHAPAMRECGAG